MVGSIIANISEMVTATATEMTIDLEKLEYISSAGLRLVVAAHKKMNGALTVKNASVEVLDVFRMTGFDKRINIQ